MIAKYGEADMSATIAQIWQQLRVCEQTFHRCLNRYGALVLQGFTTVALAPRMRRLIGGIETRLEPAYLLVKRTTAFRAAVIATTSQAVPTMETHWHAASQQLLWQDGGSTPAQPQGVKDQQNNPAYDVRHQFTRIRGQREPQPDNQRDERAHEQNGKRRKYADHEYTAPEPMG